MYANMLALSLRNMNELTRYLSILCHNMQQSLAFTGQENVIKGRARSARLIHPGQSSKLISKN